MKIEAEKVGEQDLAEKTLVLNLTLGGVTNRRKIDSHSEVIQTEVDREMLHLTKTLFDAEELAECYRFQWGLKGRIQMMSVPSFLRGGMYMVKHEAVERVDDVLSEAIEEFKPIVKAFADVVDKRRDESKERLGAAYVEAEFPTRAQVLEAFFIRWRWLSLSTPSTLKRISKAIFQRETEKAEASLKSAVKDIEALLLIETKRLTDHMLERLTPDPETGKPRVFRNSITKNMTEFLETYPLRNVVNNEQLDQQVEAMRKLMAGVTPDDLRKSDRLREDVVAGFTDVQKALDSLIVDRPRRFIDVGGEA